EYTRNGNMNGLLIGRFQPFHLGHIEALRFALSQVDNLWIGIGSSNKPTEKNNPFTANVGKKFLQYHSENEKLFQVLISEKKIISDQNWHDLVPEGTKTVLQK